MASCSLPTPNKFELDLVNGSAIALAALSPASRGIETVRFGSAAMTTTALTTLTTPTAGTG